MEYLNTWVDIKGYEGYYQINKLGQVKSIDRVVERRTGGYKQKLIGRPIKTRLSKSRGYLSVMLRKDGGNFNTVVHRLLAINFVPNPDNKPYVNHINGIKTDNRIDNLEWVTNQENSRHAHGTGLASGRKGEVNHFSKLDEEAVLKIREKGKYDTYSNMASDYGMSLNCVLSIIKRITWKHI